MIKDHQSDKQMQTLHHTPPEEEEPYAIDFGIEAGIQIAKARRTTTLTLVLPEDLALVDSTMRRMRERTLSSTESNEFLIDDINVELLQLSNLTPKSKSGVAVFIHLSSVDISQFGPLFSSTIFVPTTRKSLDEFLSQYSEVAGAIICRTKNPLSQYTEDGQAALKWFSENYDLIAFNTVDQNSGKIVLEPDNELLCRYCGESDKRKFSLIAHAFPELIGNKKIIDKCECDTCNRHFSKLVEDDFGKWTLPVRSVGRVKGKKIPALVSDRKDFQLRSKDKNNIDIFCPSDIDPRFIYDHTANRVRLTLPRQRYIPMGVFKCLVKMALAIMPNEEAILCSHLKKWILEKQHTHESFRFTPLKIFTQMVSGPLSSDTVNYQLLRRKRSSECPYMVFVVSFSNLALQIMLPMPDQDGELNENKKVISQ